MAVGKIDLSNTVQIVSDGAIATGPIGEGRLIPVVVVDCGEHRPLVELVQLHEHTPPGDVSSLWAKKLFDKKHIFLRLEFQRPVVTDVTLQFSLEKHLALVDGIMKSRGLYLQPSEFASRVSRGMEKPKILVEVPSTFPAWDALQLELVAKQFRRNGASRKDAKVLAREHIQSMSEIWARRMRGGAEDESAPSETGTHANQVGSADA